MKLGEEGKMHLDTDYWRAHIASRARRHGNPDNHACIYLGYDDKHEVSVWLYSARPKKEKPYEDHVVLLPSAYNAKRPWKIGESYVLKNLKHRSVRVTSGGPLSGGPLDMGKQKIWKKQADVHWKFFNPSKGKTQVRPDHKKIVTFWEE